MEKNWSNLLANPIHLAVRVSISEFAYVWRECRKGNQMCMDKVWDKAYSLKKFSGKGREDQPRQHIKKQRHYFASKGPSSQSYSFSSSHVWMWQLVYKESWAPKNWCIWTTVLKKILERHLDSKEIQPLLPKGNQSWIFIGRTDAETKTPVIWPPDAKNWLLGKDPDPGKDWRQEEKGTTEDEMAGWYHRLNGHGFEQAPGVDDGQGSLACCCPWGGKESDRTEWLSWTGREEREKTEVSD